MAKAAKKALTKTQLYSNIAEQTDLSKKEVAAVFDALTEEIKKSVGRNGPGQITIPGLVKIVKKKVPAKPARKGVMIAGVERDVPAKPATTKVNVRALKGLKEMVKK